MKKWWSAVLVRRQDGTLEWLTERRRDIAMGMGSVIAGFFIFLFIFLFYFFILLFFFLFFFIGTAAK